VDLTLSEQQNMLRQVVSDLRQRDFTKEALVAIDAGRESLETLWPSLVSVGILGSLIPEEYGGAGGSLMDTAVIYEELGRGPVPGPHLSSGVLAALVLLEAGTPEQKATLLPTIATGERTFALAVTEEDYGWGPEFIHCPARINGEDYAVSGTKLYVHDATEATDLIVAVRLENGAIGLLLVDVSRGGVASRALPGFASGLCEVSLLGLRVPRTSLVGGGREDGWAVLERAFLKAQLVLSAYQVGGLSEVFDMSLLYSQTRHQFGQPIGRFQRVQDHVIDIVNQLDAARWTTYEALWKVDTGQPGAVAAMHTAAVVASEAYYHGCNSAHDVHAGLGIVREYGLTLHTKLSRTLYHYLGSPRYHRKKLATALGL
jgi:alkylation response protein AidB-like acyl-CoA dehydrogenase